MKESSRKLAWIAMLYAAQVLPYGVVHKIWPVYFRAHGVSLKEIGLMSLLALPWSWKPLWAPLIDRWNAPFLGGLGRRRGWLVLANPRQGVSTPAVFRALTRRDHPALPALPAGFADAAALAGWLQQTRNDLEPAAESLLPVIGQVRAALAAQPGCLLAATRAPGLAESSPGSRSRSRWSACCWVTRTASSPVSSSNPAENAPGSISSRRSAISTSRQEWPKWVRRIPRPYSHAEQPSQEALL